MPNPVHKRQCESLFFTIENLPRHSQSLGEFSEHIFLFAAAQLPLRGEAHRPFNKLVIESTDQLWLTVLPAPPAKAAGEKY